MKLKSAEFQNYRCFGDFSIDLHPELNVFIGENGAGKTATVEGIVAALAMLNKAFDGPINSITNKDVKITSKGGKEIDGHVLCTLNPDVVLKVDFHPNMESNNDEQPIGIYKNSGAIFPGLKEKIIRDPAANEELPIYAYYRATRQVANLQSASTSPKASFGRLDAFRGAWSAFANYNYVVNWLYDLYVEELIAKDGGGGDISETKKRDFINKAVNRVIPEVRAISFTKNSPRNLILKWTLPDGTNEDRLVSQLSDGYRTMLALVIDFARRLVQANPQLDDPLSAEAVLLIDEIDLHLHPSWQQRIIGDLRKAFPKVQLIVTTHSPQVISSVKPENIYIFTDGKYERAIGEHTYGVESYRVLEDLFGVSSEPEIEEISDLKQKYQTLISAGEGESPAAEGIRDELESYVGKNAPFMINTRAEINRLKRQAS